MTAYTIIAGQLVKIGVTATGARIVPKAVYQRLPGTRTHESKQHFDRLLAIAAAKWNVSRH